MAFELLVEWVLADLVNWCPGRNLEEIGHHLVHPDPKDQVVDLVGRIFLVLKAP